MAGDGNGDGLRKAESSTDEHIVIHFNSSIEGSSGKLMDIDIVREHRNKVNLYSRLRDLGIEGDLPYCDTDSGRKFVKSRAATEAENLMKRLSGDDPALPEMQKFLSTKPEERKYKPASIDFTDERLIAEARAPRELWSMLRIAEARAVVDMGSFTRGGSFHARSGGGGPDDFRDEAELDKEYADDKDRPR